MGKGKLEHKILKTTGFTIPEGYFDTVERKILDKTSSQKRIDENAFQTSSTYFDTLEERVFSKLQAEEGLPQTGFSTPEKYFDTIDKAILTKVHTQKPTHISLKSIVFKRMIPIAIAASLALIIYLNYRKGTMNIEQVSALEIEQWIANDMIELETYEIAEVYQDVEISNPDFSSEDEENIIEYLNGTDIELILLEN